MRNLFVLVTVFLFGLTTFSQEGLLKMAENALDGEELELKAIITFEKTVIDYGTIDKGANGIKDFVFTNTGNAPLIISNVKSTCGCTIPKKPEKPILPGESDKIQVKYDTKRVGFIRKSITVTSNASNANVILKITGQVLADNNKSGLEKKKSIVEDY